ncbi:YbgA family protein [Nitrosopumilus sp.]|uniref:YbgA family protein n=1 Tax=Nitrosopumilus sp. TaxID=2024843 RepID=UPI00261B1992|nr:YbgA family protein [Nitrosopumilus sp.]
MEQHQLRLSDICDYVIEQFDKNRKKPSMNKLIEFHTKNKYLFMAFSQVDLNELGNIIANNKKLPLSVVLSNYEHSLIVLLSKTPTRKRHANVLRRMYGHFSKKLSNENRLIIETAISDYQKNCVPLNDVLHKMRNMASDIDNLYLARQTYFLLFSDKTSFPKYAS